MLQQLDYSLRLVDYLLRFVKMPLFEVAQGNLNNFSMLVYVVLWSSKQRVQKIKKRAVHITHQSNCYLNFEF